MFRKWGLFLLIVGLCSTSFAFEDAPLPKLEDLFTTLTVESVKQLSDKDGKPIPGKFVLTFDKAVSNEESVLIFSYKGKTRKQGLAKYLVTDTNPNLPVDQTKPTKKLYNFGVHKDFEMDKLVEMKALLFPIFGAPLKQKE